MMIQQTRNVATEKKTEIRIGSTEWSFTSAFEGSVAEKRTRLEATTKAEKESLMPDNRNKASEKYQRFEKEYGEGHNRRCIDGKITGCGKCTGFCQYLGHPGFLTEKLQSEHNCIGNDCMYYLPKPKRQHQSKLQSADMASTIMALAGQAVSEMEGLKVTRVRQDKDMWLIHYVTLSNEYELIAATRTIRQQCGCQVKFHRLNLDFDTCVRLIMEED